MTLYFHLSLPVKDLEASLAFYLDVLQGKAGRDMGDAKDVWVFGGQVTLQHRPDFDPGSMSANKFHFGATLDWDAWRRQRDRLEACNAPFIGKPAVSETLGQAKLYLSDPDGYVIELKAYRDIDKTLQPKSP